MLEMIQRRRQSDVVAVADSGAGALEGSLSTGALGGAALAGTLAAVSVAVGTVAGALAWLGVEINVG